MDSYPNPHQKSHSIHMQVIFQEITVLCLHIYVFLSCKAFYFVSTLLFSVISQTVQVFIIRSSMESKEKLVRYSSFYTFYVLPYLSLNLISFYFILPALSSTSMCFSPAPTIILIFTSGLLWLSPGQRIFTLSLNISIAGIFDVSKMMVLFSFQNMN